MIPTTALLSSFALCATALVLWLAGLDPSPFFSAAGVCLVVAVGAKLLLPPRRTARDICIENRSWGKVSRAWSENKR